MNTYSNSNFNKNNLFNYVKILDIDFTVTVKLCDLLKEETNIIVNASNTYLILGAGISGAIRQKGGSTIQEELSEIRKNKKIISEGDVEMTNIGSLKNKNLYKFFHAVGPKYSHWTNNDNLLEKAFYNCLKKADENKYVSISIPPISSGIFGYPIKTVSKILYDMITLFVTEKMNKREIFYLKNIFYCNNEEQGYISMIENFSIFKDNLCKSAFRFKIEVDYISFENDLEIESQFPIGEYNQEEYEMNNRNVKKILKESGMKLFVVDKKKDVEMEIQFPIGEINQEDIDKNNRKLEILESRNKLNVVEKKKGKEDKSNFKITDFFIKK